MAPREWEARKNAKKALNATRSNASLGCLRIDRNEHNLGGRDFEWEFKSPGSEPMSPIRE
jgi:hypothetical protein